MLSEMEWKTQVDRVPEFISGEAKL